MVKLSIKPKDNVTASLVRRGLGWLCIGGLLVSLTSGCSLLPREEQPLLPPLVTPEKEAFDVVDVKKGTIINQFTGVGTLASTETHSLFFRTSGGRLKSLDAALGQSVKKGDIVARLDPGDLEIRIKQRRLSLEKAQIALDQAKEEKQGDGKAIRLKAIDVESVQLELEQLQTQLENTILKADMDGIITFRASLDEGDEIKAYDTMLTISNPENKKLMYEASIASDINNVHVSMTANLKFKNKEYTGKVVQTPATAPFTENKTLADKYAKTLIIQADELPAESKIGDMVDFSIVTEQRDGVLIIPRSGLRTYMGRDYVQVLIGESRKELDVEKGIVSKTEVEIRKGLEEGQKVILNN
jgi:hypothetical protein